MIDSSPIGSWNEMFSAKAIYTFAQSPWVVQGICLATLALVIWFIVSTYRFEGRGRQLTPQQKQDDQR